MMQLSTAQSLEAPAMTRTCSRRIPRVLRFPLFFSAAAFISWTLLRVLLWFEFKPANASAADTIRAFAAGLHIDAAMALFAPVALIGFAALLTTLAWLPLWPVKTFVFRTCRSFPLWRLLFRVVITLCCMAGVFLLISEWYFFDEFESRFNTVAIDYLLYTHEVFTNIWESYPVPGIVAACLVAGGGLSWLAFRFFPPDWSGLRAGARLGTVFGWLAAAVLAFFSIRPGETTFSPQRVMNEVANNGWASAIRAAWSRNLEFNAFYVSMPRDDAFRRTRRLLEEPGATFVGPEVPDAPQPDAEGRMDETADAAWLDAARLSLTRDIAGDPAKPRRNVCIILVESLGSEFLGCLGRTGKDGKPETLTPELDKLAAEDGMLFTKVLAGGNRTIRGFEAVYSSIPPLPGDSILARDKTDRVETIGRVLKRDGYQSLFVYGGRATFDYISSYVLPNGWDRVIEEKHFENPAHTTAWGVSDEDIYHRGIEEMRAMHETGQPFLISFMTVSNHKPYSYPEGRIPEDPKVRQRTHAVKYSDWALGDFFRRAKAEKFWQDTIFVVAGDHGARVYGSQTIPLQSYQIPVFIAGPCAVEKPQRVEVPGCQLDIAPTLLGLIGRPYRSLFYGHDLLKPGAAERNKSLMHHNRSIAIYRDERQVVFGLNKSVEYWQGDIASGKMARVATPDEIFMELQHNGTAMFVTADALYTGRRYILAE